MNDHKKNQKKPAAKKLKKSAKTAKSKSEVKTHAKNLTQETTKKKHAGGRPSKKSSIDLNKLIELTQGGATDEELSKAFNICRRTLHDYKKDPKFLHIIKHGKAIADEKVVRSLYERALGYSHEDVDIRVVCNQIVKTPLIKHYPPDPTSMIFWLKNRRPEEWRDKQEHEGSGGGPIEHRITVVYEGKPV